MKILVIYATAGAGHMKAAEAVHEALKMTGYEDVHYKDVLDYTNRFYKHLYSKTYTFLISKLPWLWGVFFAVLDTPLFFSVMQAVRRLLYNLNARRFEKYLVQEDFDYIFSTHFLPVEVMGYLKRHGRIHATTVCVVTDYDVHRIWLAQGVDHYMVASDWTKNKIMKLGVAEDRVRVTGIPTLSKFSLQRDTHELKQKLGLKDGVFTVLVATGSFGIGPIEEIIAKLADFQIMVVCGHNKGLYQRLSRNQKELVKIFPLVNNMDELMAISDVMITKPGGLSISEALVSGLPIIFFNAIPGQESNNIRVLKEHGIGISGVAIDAMAGILKQFKEDNNSFHSACEQTKVLAKPNAAKDIIGIIA